MHWFALKTKPMVAIQFAPQNISCTWIERTSATTFAIKGYQKTTLHNLALEHGLIFNPTMIQQTISSFLKKYNLSEPLCAFAINGAEIKEQLITSKNEPQFADLNLSDESLWSWQASMLYTDEQQRSVHYLCALKKSTLFMYQLLAIKMHLSLVTLSTERMALFALYQLVHADAFRSTKLRTDMHRHNNLIEQIFSPEITRRLLPGITALGLRQELLPACGLHQLMEAQ